MDMYIVLYCTYCTLKANRTLIVRCKTSSGVLYLSLSAFRAASSFTYTTVQYGLSYLYTVQYSTVKV